MIVRPSLTALLALSALAHAQAGEIDAHIRALRGGDWQSRQQAEEALVAAGERSREAIVNALKDETLDIEVRDRLRSALTRIGARNLLEPTRVTSNSRFGSAFEAFERLASLGGLTVDVQNDQAGVRARSDTPIAVEWKDTPWLAALNELSARTGIAAEIVEGQRLLLFDENTPALRPPMAITGPAAVVASRVRQLETLNLGGGTARATLQLELLVSLEPKADILESSAELFLHRITDGAGNELKAELELGLTRRSERTFLSVFPLAEPRKGLTRIGLIEGELIGEMVSRSEQHRIDNLASLPRTIDLANGTIEITSIQPDPAGAILTLKLSRSLVGRPAGLAVAENHIEGLSVLDGDGKSMRLTRISEAAMGTETQFRYRIATDPGARRPASVVWTLPVQTHEFRVPFRLENLPLP